MRNPMVSLSTSHFIDESQYDIVDKMYIDELLSVVRWKPEDFDQFPSYFLTGSFRNRNSKLSLWSYPYQEVNHQEHEYEDDNPLPEKLLQTPIIGGMTELRFITDDLFLYSTNAGALFLVKLSGSDDHFSFVPVSKFLRRHYFRTGDIAACSGFSLMENHAASFGEDGKIVYFCVDQETPISILENYNEILRCLTFYKPNEVITGNLRGQVEIWDFRNLPLPSASFPHNEDMVVGVSCVTTHPSKPHVMALAGLNGSISLWDLRGKHVPVLLFDAHTSPVSNIQFHHGQPSNFFSTSVAGEVWRWGDFHEIVSRVDSDCPVLMTDIQPKVFELSGKKPVEVNGFDVYMDRLIFSTDNDSFTIIKNLKL